MGVDTTRRARRSPTPALLTGLVITLTAVLVDGWYMTRQISNLQALQTDLADRNRKDSLQLLRIQNDLNSVALAMRDMLDNEGQYPLTAWSAQFDRIRTDLQDALLKEEQVAVVTRTPEQREFLSRSVMQFWDAADRIFALAGDGREDEARAQIRLSLQARQEALATAVARLLVENNAAEEETALRIQDIYRDVQRQVYLFVGATLTMVLLTSLYLIRSNRRLFAQLASLSDERREFAQQLIATRESTLREIARELHDEFGQILTAIGTMLGRASRHAPEGTPLQADLTEVRQIAQTALDSVRALSQTLHPSILEDAGLEGTVEWYVSTVERQTGLSVSYERTGRNVPVDGAVGIHVYRVLQEAVNNVARHSGADRVWVRLSFGDHTLQLEVEDHGKGMNTDFGLRRREGLGIVAMRERASIVNGTIEFKRPNGGGTLVRLVVPIGSGSSADLQVRRGRQA